MAKPSIDILINAANQGVAKTYFEALDTYFDELSSAITTNKAIFTTSGTFTVPTGVTRVKVSGGGAGGGGASFYGSGGGAGQCVSQTAIDVTAGESITVTIGTGGLGNQTALSGAAKTPSGTFSGSNGGNTSFGSLLTLISGKGATSVGGSSGYPGAAGGVGGNRGEMINLQIYASDTFAYYNGGRGGDSLFGSGGTGGYWSAVDNTKTAGGNGIGFCSGGGGGGTHQDTGMSCTKGGDGANGYLVIEW